MGSTGRLMGRDHIVTANAPLVPILVAGPGRSGTTGIMAQLGANSRVALDRTYPFENRCLSYLGKIALLMSRPSAVEEFDQVRLNDFDDNFIGSTPWPDRSPLLLEPADWLRENWRLFSESARHQQPGTTHYAEKVAAWIPAWVRSVLPIKTIYLLRDPRDVWLSVRDFARSRPTRGFGSEGNIDETARARLLAHRWLTFAENALADGDREDVLLVRYEDWMTKSAETTARLAGWLDLELIAQSTDVTRHWDRHRTSATASGSVERWKREEMSDAVIRTLLAPLADVPAIFEYDLGQILPALTLYPKATWPHSADGTWVQVEDAARVTISGPDAWLEIPLWRFHAREVAEIWICAEGGTGDRFSIYWCGPGQGFAEARSEHVSFRPGLHRQIVRVPVHRHSLWRGTIEQLRVDVFNGAVTPSESGFVRWIRLIE